MDKKKNMILYIDTAATDKMVVALEDKGEVISKREIETDRNQAEKLVPTIQALLKKQRVDLRSLQKIRVVSHGGSFTSLRIGVITANALAYALQIPVEAAEEKALSKRRKFGRYSLVEPIYDREPNIGKPKKR